MLYIYFRPLFAVSQSDLEMTLFEDDRRFNLAAAALRRAPLTQDTLEQQQKRVASAANAGWRVATIGHFGTRSQLD